MLNVERLLSAVDLVDLVQRETKTQLTLAGSGHRGACPLHGGKNPTAFSIYENGDGQLWHCHSKCNAGGNAIQFIRRLKSIEWLDAVKYLADVARLPLGELGLTPEAVQEHQLRERRADVLDLAAEYFREHFRGNAAAQAYVAGRGFTEETAARFGYSDGERAGLQAWLIDRQADMELARETGLVRADGRDFTANAKGQQASPDGWLIYIHQRAGRVAYFSARAMTPAARMPEAKDKSRNLPGDKQLYRADVAGDHGVILVEGQADAESFRQLSLSAWALCGKALCDDDRQALRRRKPIYLALDNDAAGQERQAELADLVGPLCMIPPALPDGHKDGNAWLQAGTATDACRAWLAQAQPWIERRMEIARQTPAYMLDEVIGDICALLASLPDSVQGRYIRQAETITGIPAKDLRAKMRTADANGHGPNCSQIKDGMLCYWEEPLGNFWARITHQLTIEDGFNQPSVLFTLVGALCNGKPLPAVDIPAEEFGSMSWMMKHWGADPIVSVSPSRVWQIRRAIQEISMADMKREHQYTFTGWTLIDGQHAFLTAGGAIMADGLHADVRVNLGGGNLNHYNLPAPPEDPRAAMQESLAFLDLGPLAVTAALWSAQYAAPLTSHFRTLFATLWIYGSSQSLKTTISMLALAHFGQSFISGREARAPRDWMSTSTDLEGAMFAAKDVPLIIDDFAPQNSLADVNDLRKKAMQVVRSVGNRSARGRANSDLTSRLPRPPRGLVIATAEKLLGGVQSIEGRVVSVHIERGDIKRSEPDEPPGALDIAQTTNGQSGPGLYAQAMAAYIGWLAKYWDQHQAQLAGEYEAANQKARGLFLPAWSRLMDYYSVLMTGAGTALRFAVRCGAIDPAEHARREQAISAALIEMLKQQSARINEQSPARRFVEALSDLLTQQRAYLVRRYAEAAAAPVAGAQMVGWYDTEKLTVYLLSLPALGLVRDYLIRSGESFDVSREMLHRELNQAGLFREEEKGKDQLAASLYMGKAWSTKRVLALNDSAIEKAYGIRLYPERAIDDTAAEA